MLHNGWSNRETWLIQLWYGPESPQDVDFIKEMLEEQFDAIPSGPLKDMAIGFHDVNWDELKEQFEEEDNEEEGE